MTEQLTLLDGRDALAVVINIADMHARGRREYKSRLTTANVASIFNEYAAGATQQQIAERFGVAPSYISMLISGRRGRAIMKGAPRG